MKPIIKVETLSKQYLIGAPRSSHQTLRDALTGALRKPFKRLRSDENTSTLWALDDVSFDVRPGEAVAIIGPNGAGKSTLLKVLSRVTEPTRGRIELYGRIGSLLEVGTGFHPELTGRENLYLNGAILGMRRAEINRKFDEIVAFSEIEKFIDTPVKWYSSGMYLRLAFSVAAHLEPEILILDEVLSVGDFSFQNKCLNKMQEIREAGRTILFVSHSMQSVMRHCKRAIYLSHGKIIEDGPVQQVASTYLNSRLEASAERRWDDVREAPGTDVARLQAVRVRTEEGEVTDTVDIRKPIGIEMEFEVFKPGYVLGPNFLFWNEEGIPLFISGEEVMETRGRPREVGHYKSTVWIPGNFLAEGTHIVTASLSEPNPVVVHFSEPEAVAFHVVDSFEGDSVRGDHKGPMPGLVRPLLPWRSEFTPSAKERVLAVGDKAV